MAARTIRANLRTDVTVHANVGPPHRSASPSSKFRTTNLPALSACDSGSPQSLPTGSTLARCRTAPSRVSHNRTGAAALTETLDRLLAMADDSWEARLRVHDTVFIECVRQVKVQSLQRGHVLERLQNFYVRCAHALLALCKEQQLQLGADPETCVQQVKYVQELREERDELLRRLQSMAPLSIDDAAATDVEPRSPETVVAEKHDESEEAEKKAVLAAARAIEHIARLPPEQAWRAANAAVERMGSQARADWLVAAVGDLSDHDADVFIRTQLRQKGPQFFLQSATQLLDTSEWLALFFKLLPGFELSRRVDCFEQVIQALPQERVLPVAEVLVNLSPDTPGVAWRLFENAPKTTRSEMLDNFATGLSDEEWEELLAARAARNARKQRDGALDADRAPEAPQAHSMQRTLLKGTRSELS